MEFCFRHGGLFDCLQNRIDVFKTERSDRSGKGPCFIGPPQPCPVILHLTTMRAEPE